MQSDLAILLLHLAGFIVGFACGLVPVGLVAWLGYPVGPILVLFPWFMAAFVMAWIGRLTS